MSDTESQPPAEQQDDETIVSLDAKDMRKKKERKPYTLSAKAMEARQNALAKAKEKLQEKEHQKYLMLKQKYEEKYENKKEEKQEVEPAGDVDGEGEPVKAKPLKSGDTVMKVSNRKKKTKVIYEESSESESSEEEVIVKRKKKSSRKPKLTDDELLEMELERRLKMREENDEFAKMEKAALQKRYKEKLEETKRAHMNSYLFPSGDWSYKRK